MNLKLKQSGLSMIELLIAVVIGLFITLGMISIFDASANLNRTQHGLARLQENGRFAISSIKENLEQAGYQNCIGTSISGGILDQSPKKIPWLVLTDEVISGIPTRTQTNMDIISDPDQPYLFDPSYLIRGHECDDSDCSPELTSIGSDSSITIPDVGNANGERIAGTDVISFRYIKNNGREVDQVTTAGNLAVITFTAEDIAAHTSVPDYGDSVLLASCEGEGDIPYLARVLSSDSSSVTIELPPGMEINRTQGYSKLFGIKSDIKHITYYVANQVIDGKDIPTLYISTNGETYPLVEGVDRFDLVYGVQLSDGTVQYMNAEEVESLPVADCFREPVGSPFINGNLINREGCGWRSVVSVDLHLLMNSRNNASTNEDEPFYYTLNGNTQETASDLVSTIDHYSLIRKEFMTSIAVKNN